MMPPDRQWRREPLAWRHAKTFGRVIRKPDMIECLSNGMSVRASLDWVIENGGGESWAVIEGDNQVTPVGVYGWTRRGAIWSYWSELDPPQIKELMRRTPGMVLEMVENAAKHGLPMLSNYVWDGNREALAWLKASHCFTFNLDQCLTIGNDRTFIPFSTRPVEELRRNV